MIWSCALAFAGGPPPRPTPDHVLHWRDQVDWDEAEAEAVDHLAAYLRVDTVNPPGHEDRGVAWLASVLDREGIAHRHVSLDDGRGSLVARIPGSGEAPPLCLMHHIDVAAAEAEEWQDPQTRGPLSGAVVDGHVWGRGALDMKGMGVLQLMTFAWIQRLGVPLERDVVMLAVADEEISNLGAHQLVAEWDRIGCSHLINEGGFGVRDALFDGQAVHAISTAEKGVLWVEIRAEGRAGHGSVPHPGEAPGRLLEAMTAIDRISPRYRLDDDMADLLHDVGAHRGGLVGGILKRRWLVRTLVWPRLKAEPTMRATLHDTIHLTGVSSEIHAPNVVPSWVSATYDCRLLPGTDPEAHLARLEHAVRRVEGLSFEVIQAEGSNGSSTSDPLFEVIAHYAVEDRPHAVAGPFLSIGFTDSLLVRPIGVVAFGYTPFELAAEVAETIHGHDERVPVAEVGEGLRRLFSMVVDFAGAP